MSNWRQDGTDVEAGGDVGGDAQVSEAWSVRYTNTTEPVDGLHSMITVYFYSEGASPDGVDVTAPYGVTMQIEYMVCTDPKDPGGTQEWCDYNSLKLPDYAYDKPGEADYDARLLAEQLKTDAVELDGIEVPRLPIEWDGTPKYERDSTGWLITA